jgi:hypothetical protein
LEIDLAKNVFALHGVDEHGQGSSGAAEHACCLLVGT